MKTTYLFDFDGTLVDSSPLHDWAFREVLIAEWPEALARFDYERMRGRATSEVFLEIGVTDLVERQRLTALKQQRYQQAVREGRLPVMPGASEALAALSQAGRFLYLVTSGSRGSVELALQTTGLAPYFRGVVTASDVELGKPAPDLYLEALRRFGLNPDECLAVEDAPSGADAARAAGIDVVVVDPLGSADSLPALARGLKPVLRTWAVIPAAGLGSRLGLDRPKILAPVDEERGEADAARAAGIDVVMVDPLGSASSLPALAHGLQPVLRTWAVIPAAGLGSRLGLDRPKILAPVDEERGETIWSILEAKLKPLTGRIQVVLSPSGAKWFHGVDADIAIQDVPLGMGDAVFRGASSWAADRILVVWGDQVNLSSETFGRTLRVHAGSKRPAFVLPRVWNQSPYVQYDFNERGDVTGVRQTREGDLTDSAGWSDVGLFCLSTEGLEPLWREYLATAARGSATGEINFLPFLPFLSGRGWTTATWDVTDPDEARGVNTPSDLEFARERWRQAERR